MKRFHFAPSLISCRASTHPGITCDTPKVAGSPRSTDESNYLIADVDLSELIAKRDALRAPDIFLANIPRFFADRDN